MRMKFGERFGVTLFGESHSPLLGVEIEGIPSSLTICSSDFTKDLIRRRGGSFATTPRVEEDIPIIEPIKDGVLSISFLNTNIRPSDYAGFKRHPRPGHADFTAAVKFGSGYSSTGGGIFSGRMTLPLVAAGVVAKKIIAAKGVVVKSGIVEIGGIPVPGQYQDSPLGYPPVRELLEKVVAEGDSVGAILRTEAVGVPAGLGEPFFDSLESRLAHILFSIPGIRGVEFGDGFNASKMRGSQHNDPIISSSGETAKNGCGGINGGISNGNPILFRVAAKPTSTISVPQMTFDFEKMEMAPLVGKGRHDACFALRLPPVVEAACAIVLADNFLMTE